MKAAQKDLKRIIRKGKREYSLKLEEKVQAQDSKAVWNSLKLITGCGVTSKSLQEEGITPNEVNIFFARFNTIQPHLMASKLKNYNLHSSTIAWVMDYSNIKASVCQA